MISADRARRVVERYVEVWREGSREDYLALFTEDAVATDPWGSPPRHGPAQIGGLWDIAHQASLSYEPVVHRIALCAERAMLSFTMRGHAPGGGGVEVDIIDVFSLTDDGRIAAIEAYWDSDCMRNLPMESSP